MAFEKTEKNWVLRFLCLGWFGLLMSCGSGLDVGDDVRLIRVWSHQGQEAENQAVRDMAAAFNQAHAGQAIQVELNFFPDFQYTEKLSIAAAGGDMPDVFDLDGPTVAQFASAGLLARLNPLLTDFPLEDFQPPILEQGTYQGELFALGAFDSALVLYADRALLEHAGVSPPESEMGWTWDEFIEACEMLKNAGHIPVALHMDASADEWFTYAFSPLLWSAGGRMISLDGSRVDGVLNREANIQALTKWQNLFELGYARKAPVNPNPFASGETAMDWTGHWMARGHLEVKGDKLIAMPLPRIGSKPAAASGSWCWAVSSTTSDREAAVAWMKWVLGPETGIQPVVSANGAIPSRASAYSLFPDYQKEPFATFRYLQENHAQARPQTPIYPNLTQHVAAALRDIASGVDVKTRLDEAALAVQRIVDRRKRSPL